MFPSVLVGMHSLFRHGTLFVCVFAQWWLLLAARRGTFYAPARIQGGPNAKQTKKTLKLLIVFANRIKVS